MTPERHFEINWLLANKWLKSEGIDLKLIVLTQEYRKIMLHIQDVQEIQKV